MVQRDAGAVRPDQRARGLDGDGQARRGAVEHGEVLALVPQPAGGQHRGGGRDLGGRRRGIAPVRHDERRHAEAVDAPRRFREGRARRRDRVGRGQSGLVQGGAPAEVLGQGLVAPHSLPPGRQTGMRDHQRGAGEGGIGAQRRVVEVDEVGAVAPRQIRQRVGAGPHRGGIGGEPVRGMAEVVQGETARRRVGALRVGGGGAEHRQGDAAPAPRQRRPEVERIGPDAADRVGRHEDMTAVARHRQQAASRSCSGRGCWSWISLIRSNWAR